MYDHSFTITRAVGSFPLDNVIIHTEKHWSKLTLEDFIDGMADQIRRDAERCKIVPMCFEYEGSFTPQGFQKL